MGEMLTLESLRLCRRDGTAKSAGLRVQVLHPLDELLPAEGGAQGLKLPLAELHLNEKVA